jgi:acyl-CoA synthetase (AMP-forming)/AMP-acid ligase II
LCVARTTDADRVALNLSSWRAAFVAAEPVRAETLDRFATAFAECGFDRRAFRPCYGLAEATVFVTAGPPGGSPVVRRFDRRALDRGQVIPRSSSAEASRDLVGCGRPWLDQRIMIVDPEARRPTPPDQVGEIWVNGPGVARGYWRRPVETADTFSAVLEGEPAGHWLRTGDLGFIADGDLFITGRLKELIIIRGQNYYPADIEATIGGVDAGLVPHAAAAFSVAVQGEERLAIVHELHRHAALSAGPGIIASIREAVAAEHAIRAEVVVLVGPGGLPRTTSGKVRRRTCRDHLLNGTLDVRAADYGEWSRGEFRT